MDKCLSTSIYASISMNIALAQKTTTSHKATEKNLILLFTWVDSYYCRLCAQVTQWVVW